MPARVLPRAIALVLFGSACAIGEMPGADPLGDDLATDGGSGGGTPLTTGADAGEGDTGGPGDDANGDDANGEDTNADDGTNAGDDADAGDDANTDASDDADPEGTSDDGSDDAGTTAAIDEGGETTDTGALETDGGTETGATADDIDLSGYAIVQTMSDRTLTLPAGTVVPAGGYLVIGRNATLAQFEAFWGPLPADAVYLDAMAQGGEEFPTINGDETYEL